MTAEELVGMMAARLRAMSDADLVAVAAPTLMLQAATVQLPAVPIPPPLPQLPTVNAREVMKQARVQRDRAWKQPPSAKKASKRSEARRNANAPGVSADALYKVLISAPGMLKPGEACRLAGLGMNQGRAAFYQLRKQGKAFGRGHALGSRWAADESALDGV